MIIKQAYLPLIGRVCFFLDRYTDFFDIDEDVNAIPHFDGDWHSVTGCGIFPRSFDVPSSWFDGVVASRLITIERNIIPLTRTPTISVKTTVVFPRSMVATWMMWLLEYFIGSCLTFRLRLSVMSLLGWHLHGRPRHR